MRPAPVVAALLMCKSPYLRLRLCQPWVHSHLTVHGDRGHEALPGVYPVAAVAGDLAEAEVAVGDERTHAQFVGQRQGLAEVPLGCLKVGRVTVGCGLTEEAQGPRLVAAFTAFAAKPQGTVTDSEIAPEPDG